MFEIEKAYLDALKTYTDEVNEYVKKVLPDLKKESNASKLLDAVASLPIPDKILEEADCSIQKMISSASLSERQRKDVGEAVRASRQRYECAMNEKRLLAKHVFMFTETDKVVG